MDRNLDRRVEAIAPVEDHDAQARLAGIIEVMLADDRRSWQLQPDATWVRTETIEGREGTIDTFETLKEEALASGASWPPRGAPVPAPALWTRGHDRDHCPARRGRAQVPRRRPGRRRALS